MRRSTIEAIVVQLSVVGSHASAARTPSSAVRLDWLEPPTARTLPSGSRTRLWLKRGYAIGAVDRQVGFAWLRSMTAVPAWTGSALFVPPPVARILPGR